MLEELIKVFSSRKGDRDENDISTRMNPTEKEIRDELGV